MLITEELWGNMERLCIPQARPTVSGCKSRAPREISAVLVGKDRKDTVPEVQ